MRRPSAFKKTDVIRATKAILAAGLEVARVEISKDGVIVVVPEKVGRRRERGSDFEPSFSHASQDIPPRSVRSRSTR
jgi:hypothetical protein